LFFFGGPTQGFSALIGMKISPLPILFNRFAGRSVAWKTGKADIPEPGFFYASTLKNPKFGYAANF
jgi:hypothetical protein